MDVAALDSEEDTEADREPQVKWSGTLVSNRKGF
jgi:hypothetical protein